MGKYKDAAAKLRIAQHDLDSGYETLQAPITDVEMYPDIAGAIKQEERDKEQLYEYDIVESYSRIPPAMEQIQRDFKHFIYQMEREQIEYDLGSENVLKTLGKAENGKLVVGQRAYETVLIPDHMENLDRTTYDLLKDDFVCSERGEFEVKGFGEQTLYFLERER